jgi:hypothetical protein
MLSREINQTSNGKNSGACANHHNSLWLRFYDCICTRRRALRGGDMEVATRAGMVVIQVATKDILGVKPAASMDGLQAAQRRGTIS